MSDIPSVENQLNGNGENVTAEVTPSDPVTEVNPLTTAVDETAALTKKIVRQIEYYFGNFNLHRDSFMREQMEQNDGWFTMETMLKFKRLASLCSEPETILKIVKENIGQLMDVDFESKSIRRKPSKKVPENNDDYKKQLNERTVYIKGFQQEENIDDIHDFLTEYGKIEGIQLRRFPQNKKFKGSLMASFFKQEDAVKFIQAPMVYYKCNELQKMSKKDFLKEKEQEKENFKQQKQKKQEEMEEQKKKDEFRNLVFIKISGVTDDTITHVDIKSVFETSGIESVKFFDRYEKHGSEGYAVYSGDLNSEQVLKTIEENKGSCTLKIKTADVTFEDAGDELEKMKDMYRDFRSRFSRDGKKGKGKFQKNKRNQQNHKHRGKKTKFSEEDEDNNNVSEKVAPKSDDPPQAKRIKVDGADE